MGLLNPYLKGTKLLSVALVAFVVGSSLGGTIWYLGNIYFLGKQPLVTFSSDQELAAFLRMGPTAMPQSLLEKLQSMLWGSPKSYSTFDLGRSPLLEGTTPIPDYSVTNIQVGGVDEADIVKTDGKYLYIVSGSAIHILQAYPPEDAKELVKIDLNRTIAGIFVREDRLIVISTDSSPNEVFRGQAYTVGHSSILVYNIVNRSEPVLERDLSVDGTPFSSRMIEDYLYAVVSEQAFLVNSSTANLPKIRSGNITTCVDASSIYHSELPDYYYFYVNIVAVNTRDASQKPVVKTFLTGAASCIYVSRENIYLTSYSSSGTNIHKVNVRNGEIEYKGDGTVPNYVLNQFSMDEYDGFFRIATSDGKSNSVYVLDERLNIIGRLEGLAPGERIYSARFMGDKCYLVTYMKVDPLFVIDMSDPRNLKVLGKLKIPGYSDYLHPYDEEHLIGVGKETVPAEQGSFSWYQGVKISLFDVSNVSQPKEIAKFEIGDRGTDSPVLRDHKAFLFSRAKDLLVLPILLAEIDPAKYPGGIPTNAYGDYVWQGAYVFNITESGITLEGRISHMKDDVDLVKSGYYFDSAYSVKRSLYIGDALYTISDKMVKINNLADLGEINTLELP